MKSLICFFLEHEWKSVGQFIDEDADLNGYFYAILEEEKCSRCGKSRDIWVGWISPKEAEKWQKN